MERFLIVLFAAVGGGMIAAQAPINARLRLSVGSPMLSAALSFAVGTVALAVGVLATGALGGVRQAGSAPWWAWLGGLAGAMLVTASLIAAPRLGATTTFVAIISGQVLVAVILDRFGWLGLSARPLTTERLLALVMMLGALALLLRE